MPRSIDNRLDFLSPVSLIPGLGSKRAEALHQSGIDTFGDLLYHFPTRYIDRSVITPIARLHTLLESPATVIGTITKTRLERGVRSRLRIQISDDTGAMEALWFHGVAFLRKTLHTGLRILCTGTIKHFAGASMQMIHPQLETLGENNLLPPYPYLPHYPITAAMAEVHLQQKSLCKAILWILDNLSHYPQVFPQALEREKRFPPLAQCLREIHVPSDLRGLARFKDRIAYEELYKLAISLHWNKRKFAQPGRSLEPGSLVEIFKRMLPFELTQEQNRAIDILLADALSRRRMHRLLQGDVGSGKTVVAFCACLPAFQASMQVAWLAPTEVLAKQSFSLLSPWCRKLNLSIDLLTGSSPVHDKAEILRTLKNGELRCIVGTHALLQPAVTFKNLGMIVIDEQHKFGAGQRLALQEKDPRADFLLMSATPIPQTLAKTLYGDLDVVSIKGLPRGRLPVSTHWVPLQKRPQMETFITNEILHNNAQAFYVVPRIERGEEDGAGLKDAVSTFESLTRGTLNAIPCALVHGQTDPEKRQRIMEDFSAGLVKILVATTIIEVGIDVPAATIMVIENAERFGLSQLHQLRGRVGRSTGKSYCFLLANPLENGESQKRLEYFCKHLDGFEIAEMDLRLRGPGEAAGRMQSGWDDLKIADIIRDAALFQEILKVLESYPLSDSGR
jgi:ATP-dependent DNA helicase RecG